MARQGLAKIKPVLLRELPAQQREVLTGKGDLAQIAVDEGRKSQGKRFWDHALVIAGWGNLYQTGTKYAFSLLAGMDVRTQACDSELRALATGTWHIVMTDLPLWRKRSGTVSYLTLPGGEMADVITWQRHGRLGRVLGIDRPIDEDGWQWEWRGVEPLTLLTRSRWRFLAGNLKQGWAVTAFEKTMFTPAGFDIYARVPQPGHGQLSAALSSLPEDVARRLFLPPAWSGSELAFSD